MKRADERTARWTRRFDWVVLVAAALVVPVVLIEQSDASEPWPTIAGLANWAIWLIFLAEVVVMLMLVPNKWRWIRENPLDVAIVVLTPPFVPAALQTLRAFRLLRLLRLLRALVAVRRLFSPDGFKWVAFLTLLTVFCGGAAFAAVEKGQNDQVQNTWDGVWWAFSTMTTVGYGDVRPTTEAGRMIAIVVMVVGIGFLSFLIGVVSQQFIQPKMQEGDVELERELVAAESDVRAELRVIAARLQELERRLARSAERRDRRDGRRHNDRIAIR